MAAPPCDRSYLLDLPMELLQRITSQLDQQETIPCVRLACKALEAATLDRFAATFVRAPHCCVLYKARVVRLRRLLEASPRLSSLVASVTLTTCWLEGKPAHHIQIAPAQESETLLQTQHEYMHSFGIEQEAAPQKSEAFDVALITRMLLDFKDKFPQIQLRFDFTTDRDPRLERRLPVHHDMLVAAIHTESKLTELALSFPCLRNLGSLLRHQRSDLISSTSPLRSFTFGQDRDKLRKAFFKVGDADVIADILENAPKLEVLELDLRTFAVFATKQFSPSMGFPQRIAEKFLRAACNAKIAQFEPLLCSAFGTRAVGSSCGLGLELGVP